MQLAIIGKVLSDSDNWELSTSYTNKFISKKLEFKSFLLNSRQGKSAAIPDMNHSKQETMTRLNIKGKIREWERPFVMGIINVTPDSFYAGSRVDANRVGETALKMVESGCDILDIGGYSSRPGADTVTETEECRRLLPALESIREAVGPEILVSVDTFRAAVAEACISAGADIINDISGGDLDPDMYDTVSRLNAPYIMMHTRGTPADMQRFTDYRDITADVIRDLASKLDKLHQLGAADIIVDPGFGFAKTLDQNYRLMAELRAFKALGCPVLVGISRKSMIYNELGITPQEALSGTIALNMAALLEGADILRVHDVKEAVETVKIYEAIKRNSSDDGTRIITESGSRTERKATVI